MWKRGLFDEDLVPTVIFIAHGLCLWVVLLQGRAQGKVGLTLLSELGIMVSVIQEPKRDPDARTVMGLLTPVNFPQPGGTNR